ncbi:AraC family transcriptional regulator [Kutzneria buriramensis]|uniref:AraC-like DNA-binding protein n=1 Tax=Kutzneria buriramensis TaxID=1045776 RepID=A0A3E0HEN3_9PSEU|nr:helix-turn-helix transcriptional regulator [Kutzneria buriramensis]REH43670.1 AraC-like DNA-binding protein [Kutzneria buriramensis]
MVGSGQRSAVAEFGFSNPDRPRLGLEVVDFAKLAARLPASTLSTVHRTDFHQLFLITGGTGAAMVDFVEHECVPGTLVSVSPGRVLRLPRPTGGGRLEALMVLFTDTFPHRPEAVRPLLSPFGPVAWTVPEPDRTDLTRAVRELMTEYQRAVDRGEPITVDLLRQLLGALLLRIARLPADGRPAAQDETYTRFQHELERSFATTRSAADYAAKVGYSLRTLNRVCEAAAGRSAKALVDARVALEAKRLLVHTDLPAAAIGDRLGFTEPTNFGKFFQRETGETPGAFRDRERVTAAGR